ncbi:MAG: hypothetical protein V5A44_03970 [Haloarculaceae archaeon]
MTEVETAREVSAFVRGRAPRRDDGRGGGTERVPTLIVQRVAPNDTVIGEMQVYDNESVRIVQDNRTNEERRGPG